MKIRSSPMCVAEAGQYGGVFCVRGECGGSGLVTLAADVRRWYCVAKQHREGDGARWWFTGWSRGWVICAVSN